MYRRYPNFDKSVMVLRQQLRSSGFLVGFENSSLPFYSADLKQVLLCYYKLTPTFYALKELHSNLHNFKKIGEEVSDSAHSESHNQ